jgi:hypothetical protein
VSKIWRCALRVKSRHSGIESTLYGYGQTAEKAWREARDLATYRKEAFVPDTKPRLTQVEDQ